MNAFLRLLASTLIVALSASLAFGQTATGKPAGGASPGSAPEAGLDLPVEKPAFVEEEEEEEKPDEEEPPTLYDEDLPAKTSITYVVDISGSMDWGNTSWTDTDGSKRRGTPLDRAKFEMIKSINALSKNFQFNCISYDCANSALWNAHRDATDENKSAARGWIMALRAMGATGTGGATVRGLKAEKDALVLLTDGAPNCNPDNWDWNKSDCDIHKNFILSNNPNRVKISCIGIGDYGEFAKFLQQVAGATGGTYVHVQ